ncbi:MAG TPA: HlyD family efflux transporter periplasmic adaptor subunit [Gemmatimonadales bacterium]
MTAHPRLRADIVIVQQTYRGEETYIVKDPTTHKYFRFKPLEVLVMRQFTGDHAPAELAAALTEQGLPLPVAMIEGFARKLKGMNLLERSLAEKSVMQLERLRAERHRRVKNTSYEGSILRMRWSVGDPDKLFDRWLPRLMFFFRPPFLITSVVLFAIYLTIFFVQLPAIANGILAMYSPSFYTLQTIFLFWGTAMVVIAIHELGHGLACKYFGGQVHELGAMLLYFQPAFYCNVNDAWTFPERNQRIWVTAAGSWIQVVIAALASMVWLVVEPGTVVSQVCFFALIIGGATTVLANANPLIPLDGYYALSDYLEIPNLRQRALGYLGWLLRRYLLRLNIPEPPADSRERRVFTIYGILAILYITSILSVFGVLFGRWAGRTFGGLGLLAFAILLWLSLRGMIRDWSRAVVTSFKEHRAFWLARRTWMGFGIGVVGLLSLAFAPWPIRVRAPFVTAPVFDVTLVAPEDGVVERVFVREGAAVEAGAAIARLRNFALERDVLALAREADSLDVRLAVLREAGRLSEAREAELVRGEVGALLDAGRRRVSLLTVRAPVTGTVVTPRIAEAVGDHIPAGDPVVRLLVADSVEVRLQIGKAGAASLEVGQAVELITHVGQRRRVAARLSGVSVAAGGQAVEARARVVRGAGDLRPGVTGLARITVRRSTLGGALWWALRKRIRNDLLL